MKTKLHFAVFTFFTFITVSIAQVSEKEAEARLWLKANEAKLNINPNDAFSLRFARKTQAGETLRFQQLKNGVPVFDSEIVVHFSPYGEISSTASSYDNTVADINTVPTVTKENSIVISNEALQISGDITFQESKLVVHNKLGGTKLVYRVLTNSYDKVGSWETIIDAQTGAVLSTKDVACYYKNHKHNIKENKSNQPVSMTPLAFVSGTGMVFNPDPLSQAGVNYGDVGYTDGSDAATTQMNNARISVTLPEIDLTAGTYKLKSTYAEIKELGSPNKGLFTQSSSAFNFTRLEDGFEAVTAFYHLDKSLRYINQTLGITCVPYQSANAGAVFFDPHGANSADNSFYGNGQLQFGEGGVDDAEDADVVLHELGHGLHDWITGGGLSQVNGLSEGCGDYWAVSYSRSLNQWASDAPQYNYVFSWDGHNPFWNGRTTGYGASYNGGLVNQIHTDGQIWATALMKIWDGIGREKTDKAFLNGLDLTTSNTNQQNAAIAVRTAAINMNYPCTDVAVMTQKFTEAGYAMPALTLTMNPIVTQTVQADVSNTYTLPSFATLSNPITDGCNAGLTQSPAAGTVLATGDYTITMVATSGASTVNRTFTLTVLPYLSVAENVKNNFIIYPNPASNQITVKGEFDANENVTIYNVLGQVVMTKAIFSNEESIDISTLSSGVYTVTFNAAKVSRKFIKE
ncbi:MAG: T9SS type A sorting domain-containing protein [Flavobacterium sp.]|nr:T9SS type A sorting domain-containing protein [Flavobacterium sp.]MBP8156817.1 T9SS type A sorting domain-containing protein [Flavobacterium sp.]